MGFTFRVDCTKHRETVLRSVQSAVLGTSLTTVDCGPSVDENRGNGPDGGWEPRGWEPAIAEVYSLTFIIGVVTALRRSQLSRKSQNVREKVGANGKMLWWKWYDTPFGEGRAWKSNIGGWLTGCGEM